MEQLMNRLIIMISAFLLVYGGSLKAAEFTASPTYTLAGQSITFDAAASAGEIAEYQWDFDDDGIIDRTTSEPVVTHAYSALGTYSVTLKTFDAQGAQIGERREIGLINVFEPHEENPRWIYSLPECVLQQLATLTEEQKKSLRDGYLDVTLYDNCGYTVDPTGSADSTAGLQKALEDARDHALVGFFPSGTYLVSDTLFIRQKAYFGYSGDTPRLFGTFYRSVCMQGSVQGDRPVIKLIDHSSEFDNPNNGAWKPVVHIATASGSLSDYDNVPNDVNADNLPDPPDPPEGSNFGFNQCFKNINIDVGAGNAGAIGLRFATAQGGSIEDVKVYSSSNSSFYAGFYELPSASMGAVNIEVDGGQYGIHFGGSAQERHYAQPPSVIVGATLKHQTQRAVYLTRSWAPNNLIGFHIVKDTAPAIEIDDAWFDIGSTMHLQDGVIEIANQTSEAIISNRHGQNLYVRDLYTSGNQNIIAGPTHTTSINDYSAWTKTNEYSYRDVDHRLLPSYSLIDGQLNPSDIINVQEAVDIPPTDLLSRHVWDSLPTFEDSDTVNIKNFGAVGNGIIDDTLALQNAIDQSPSGKVFIPKGKYLITDTITLHANTKLFGSNHSSAMIIASDTWRPTSEVPVITTVDDPDARTYLGHIAIYAPYSNVNHAYFNKIHWKAGRHSMVKSIETITKWVPDNQGTARSEYKISGSGGGRWYFTLHHAINARSDHPDYRLLTTEDTFEPLTFYGLNLEHAVRSPFVEIRNSQNVRVFGSKTESDHQVYRIVNSENIMITGIGGHTGLINPGDAVVSVEDSDNVVLALLGHIKNLPDDTITFNEDYFQSTLHSEGSLFRTTITRPDAYMVYERNTSGSDFSMPQSGLVTLYKKGEVNMSVFAFSDAGPDDSGDDTGPDEPGDDSVPNDQGDGSGADETGGSNNSSGSSGCFIQLLF